MQVQVLHKKPKERTKTKLRAAHGLMMQHRKVALQHTASVQLGQVADSVPLRIAQDLIFLGGRQLRFTLLL